MSKSSNDILKQLADKTKNLSPEKQALAMAVFGQEMKEIEAEKKVNKRLAEFITTNKQLIRAKEKIKILSEKSDTVLITGPTGTGKELLATALHGEREGKFIALNCAGIPENLIESELFGHVKGAFTGAITDKVGLLQSAWDGTIFLDEVGDLPMAAQAKLLRALQERKIRRVGADMSTAADRDIDINCRFVFATHRDLHLMTKSKMFGGFEKDFREDLFWRIQTVTIKTLPLSERTDDIYPIVRNLVAKDRDIIHEIPDLQEFCRKIIEKRDNLTGNVRQLQSLVRNYHLFGEGPDI